ncbi:MAG: DNA primase catalytic subunit PriS [Methanotrichaceae archaeon]|nr:DNA primase catalytic subunit PriS [Methanotrichaceae archaeon]
MKSPTRSFMISKFQEYYQANSLEIPPILDSREWGFISFHDEKGMRRHRSYLTKTELMDYIRSVVPAHIYHSTAYYHRPSASTMKEKIWKGADLIFDLDADHLREVPESYTKMLSLVKKETLKLITILTTDLGFDEKSINIVFSGGRGYHIHIRHPLVLPLESDERREIVDYITGRGLDIENFINIDLIKYNYDSKRVSKLRGPSESSSGWGKRINRALESYIIYLQELKEEDAIRVLCRTRGIGKKRAMTFYEGILNKNIIREIRFGNLDFFKGSSEIWQKLLIEYKKGEGAELAKCIEKERGMIDEPVTSDVKRLIRCPGSLHGGSGFRVTPLCIQDLEDFDPLWDAIVFGEDPISIEITKPFIAELCGQSYRMLPGKTEVPLQAAVFLIARGAAELSSL